MTQHAKYHDARTAGVQGFLVWERQIYTGHLHRLPESAEPVGPLLLVDVLLPRLPHHDLAGARHLVPLHRSLQLIPKTKSPNNIWTRVASFGVSIYCQQVLFQNYTSIVLMKQP